MQSNVDRTICFTPAGLRVVWIILQLLSKSRTFAEITELGIKVSDAKTLAPFRIKSTLLVKVLTCLVSADLSVSLHYYTTHEWCASNAHHARQQS